MATENQNPEQKNAEEKYREGGVEGNDQNAAIRKDGKTGQENTLGNAEQSERGKAEFNADLGENEHSKPSSGHKQKHSERGLTEFEEDQDSIQ